MNEEAPTRPAHIRKFKPELPLLGAVRARNRFVNILGEVRDVSGFAKVGFVVMPEHVRLLIGEPAMGTPSKVLQVLKQRVERSSSL